MLKAAVSRKSPCFSWQTYCLNFAIAYYENEQWISEGWKTLVASQSDGTKEEIVLLNQPLTKRCYYFNFRLQIKGHKLNRGPTRHHFSLHGGESYPFSSERFWLEDGNFKKSNAKYSGGEFSRFMQNIFDNSKWAGGWSEVDVGWATDYTIKFELSEHLEMHYHYH